MQQMSQPTPVMAPTPQRIGKFKASLMIAKASWNLLVQDKEMLWFPILSLLASLAVFVVGMVIFFFSVLGGDIAAVEQMSESQSVSPVSYAGLFLVYFVSYFITIFFQTGIVAIVNGRINGQDLSFSDGLRVASDHIGKIAAWSAFSATVGVILRAISDRSAWLGKLVAGLLGAVWSIATFFIVPVLIFEKGSVMDSLRSSGDTVKKMWGEAIIVNVGAGFVFMMLAFGGVFLFIASLFTGNGTLILWSVLALILYFFVLALISSTLDVIFRVVLYQYAKQGVVPEGISPEVLQMVFKRKDN